MILLVDKKAIWKKIMNGILVLFVFVFVASSAFLSIQWYLNPSLKANLQASAFGSIQFVEQPDLADLKTENDSKINPVGNEISNSVNARSAISIEFDKGYMQKTLYEKNSDEKLPIASLVKLMTALVVFKNFDLEKEITISKSVMSQVWEQGNLKEGQVLGTNIFF